MPVDLSAVLASVAADLAAQDRLAAEMGLRPSDHDYVEVRRADLEALMTAATQAGAQ